MKRREFLIEAGKAFPILAGASYFIACSSSPTTPVSPTPAPVPTAIKVVSSNSGGHTHTASLPLADLTATTTRSYRSSVDSGHPHTVTLTAADLATINGGGSVTVISSVDDGHNHEFTFKR